MSAMARGEVQIGDGEATLKVRGSSFVAVDTVPGRCTAGPRCAFAVGFGCKLVEVSGSNWCQAKDRQDGRSVVWVSRAG